MKLLFLLTLAFTLTFLPACKKELVDTSKNTIEDVNSKQTFEERIATGVSMAFFHASWCHICEEQRPSIEALASNPDAAFATIVEVEYEDNKEIVDQYNVPGFPTIVFFVDGVEKERLKGSGHSEEKLLNILEKYRI